MKSKGNLDINNRIPAVIERQHHRADQASGAVGQPPLPSTPILWLEKTLEEQEWRYVPELISPEQIAALNELLALPLTGELGFHFREDD